MNKTEEIVIDFRNYGKDLALHKGLIYHFAGVPIEDINLYVEEAPSIIHKGFHEGVKLAGEFDFAIIGYRRSLVRDFTLRKLAMLKAMRLKEIFGNQLSRKPILNKIKMLFIIRNGLNNKYNEFSKQSEKFIEFVVNEPSESFFRFSSAYFQLASMEKIMLSLASEGVPKALSEIMYKGGFCFDSRKPGNKGKAGYFIKAPFDMTKFKVTLNDGKKVSILATKHPFGDLTSSLLLTIRSKRVKKVIFIGSAGGLSPDMKPGDIVVPKRFSLYKKDLNFERGAGENAFLGLKNFSPANFYSTTNHCSVPSPLLETQDLIKSMKKLNFESVDCEASHLFLRNSIKPMIGAMFLITDIPGQKDTLEEYNPNARNLLESQMKILDAVISFFGIADVQLQ